jgi:ribosomal protein S18 acetylase RimI-like enzyme
MNNPDSSRINIRNDLVIRDAREEEQGAIRDLTLRVYGEYAAIMTPAAWAGLEQAVRGALASEEAREQIVAERGGAFVGSVLLFPPATDAYHGLVPHATWPEVRLLAVAPEARGQGVGRALMNECVRRARHAGAAELGLHTSKSMQVAIGMYERMGFVRAPEFDFQPEGAELVQAFRLRLDAPGLEKALTTAPPPAGDKDKQEQQR